jgi:voltage-gated potassium channel
VTLITVATLVFLVLYVIVLFAWTYWDIGTFTNFGQPLTHIDALYVSVGTLSTAGTGSISAMSKLARGIQSAQMTIDMVLVVFVAGVVVTRFMAGRQEPRASE